MSARNIYHDDVVKALKADGWTITNDPLTLTIGKRDLYVDLGATKATLAAERNGQRIAVEIQTFAGPSVIHDFHLAIGQYVVYRAVLSVVDPNRTLYMAVTDQVHEGIFSESIGRLVATDLRVKLLVFNQLSSEVRQWID